MCSYADPKCFIRGGPSLIMLVFSVLFFLCFFFCLLFLAYKGRSARIKKTLKVGPHRPTSETTFRWRADDGQALNDGLVAL